MLLPFIKYTILGIIPCFSLMAMELDPNVHNENSQWVQIMGIEPTPQKKIHPQIWDSWKKLDQFQHQTLENFKNGIKKGILYVHALEDMEGASDIFVQTWNEKHPEKPISYPTKGYLQVSPEEFVNHYVDGVLKHRYNIAGSIISFNEGEIYSPAQTWGSVGFILSFEPENLIMTCRGDCKSGAVYFNGFDLGNRLKTLGVDIFDNDTGKRKKSTLEDLSTSKISRRAQELGNIRSLDSLVKFPDIVVKNNNQTIMANMNEVVIASCVKTPSKGVLTPKIIGVFINEDPKGASVLKKFYQHSTKWKNAIEKYANDHGLPIIKFNGRDYFFKVSKENIQKLYAESNFTPPTMNEEKTSSQPDRLTNNEEHILYDFFEKQSSQKEYRFTADDLKVLGLTAETAKNKYTLYEEGNKKLKNLFTNIVELDPTIQDENSLSMRTKAMALEPTPQDQVNPETWASWAALNDYQRQTLENFKKGIKKGVLYIHAVEIIDVDKAIRKKFISSWNQLNPDTPLNPDDYRAESFYTKAPPLPIGEGQLITPKKFVDHYVQTMMKDRYNIAGSIIAFNDNFPFAPTQTFGSSGFIMSFEPENLLMTCRSDCKSGAIFFMNSFDKLSNPITLGVNMPLGCMSNDTTCTPQWVDKASAKNPDEKESILEDLELTPESRRQEALKNFISLDSLIKFPKLTKISLKNAQKKALKTPEGKKIPSVIAEMNEVVITPWVVTPDKGVLSAKIIGVFINDAPFTYSFPPQFYNDSFIWKQALVDYAHEHHLPIIRFNNHDFIVELDKQPLKELYQDLLAYKKDTLDPGNVSENPKEIFKSYNQSIITLAPDHYRFTKDDLQTFGLHSDKISPTLSKHHK